MRIASYNIRKTRGLDQRYDAGRVVDAINSIGAEVVALQEADHRLGERPAAISADLIEAETEPIYKKIIKKPLRSWKPWKRNEEMGPLTVDWIVPDKQTDLK